MKSKELKQALIALNKAKRTWDRYDKDYRWDLKGKVEIDFDRHVLRNQNKEFMVEYSLNPWDCKGEGVCLVNLKNLKEFAQNVKGDVTFEKRRKLWLTIGKSKKSFSFDDKIALPERFPGTMGKRPKRLPFADVKAFFQTMYSFAARDGYSPTLNGIYLDTEKAVATDGHCLIAKDLLFRYRASIIIKNPLNILKSVKGAEEILIKSGKDAVMYTAGNFFIVAKNIKGDFPPWKRVVSDEKGCLSPVHIDIEDIKAAKAIANPITRQGDLYFAEDGVLGIHTRCDMDDARTVGKYRGERPSLGICNPWHMRKEEEKQGHSISFNLKYMHMVMKAMGGDPEILFQGGRYEGTLLKNEAGDLALLMPVKAPTITEESIRMLAIGA